MAKVCDIEGMRTRGFPRVPILNLRLRGCAFRSWERIRIDAQQSKQDLTIYVDRHIPMIRISGSCELASSYQRRIK